MKFMMEMARVTPFNSQSLFEKVFVLYRAVFLNDFANDLLGPRHSRECKVERDKREDSYFFLFFL